MKAAERREHLKESLIEAAERVIDSRGLATLRARDLAREVGCALGAIYNVFPDLNALIIAVNSRTLAMLDQALAGGELKAKPTSATSSEQPAVASLVNLALRYLEFAAAHPFRWRALFEHRMPEGQSIPDFHLAEQVRLFTYVEEPLRALRPELKGRDRALLARSLFSAVHGIVSLGLEEKLVPMPLPTLKQQLAYVVRATANGIVLSPVRSARTS
jgi:AcrR family transcriptional regulator